MQPGHLANRVPVLNNDLSSMGTRGSRYPLAGNILHINQFQSSHWSGSKQDIAVLRRANSAHNLANARDPVVMNILKRTEAKRPVSAQEQQLLENRLLYNEKRLAALQAHKHASNVSYELKVEANGNSHIEVLVNGRPEVFNESDNFLGRR